MASLLPAYLKSRQAAVDRALKTFLPAAAVKPPVIHEAMRYSVFAGGKRLRPILVIAGAEICGGSAQKVLPTACAMELIHTYSLVHDDLPAMDDDDLRRGRPTSHKVFGEDIAILTGDALLTHAFTLIRRNAFVKGVSPYAVLDVVDYVALGSGTHGMIGGQVADIQADKGRWRKLKDRSFRSPAELLEFIHINKTAALIRASLLAGARLAGASRHQLQALAAYGTRIGLAFQIQDDILDRVGDKKKLGKRGSDRANKKLTFPLLYGMELSQARAQLLVAQAREALKIFGKKAIVLNELADYVLNRDH